MIKYDRKSTKYLSISRESTLRCQAQCGGQCGQRPGCPRQLDSGHGAQWRGARQGQAAAGDSVQSSPGQVCLERYLFHCLIF